MKQSESGRNGAGSLLKKAVRRQKVHGKLPRLHQQLGREHRPRQCHRHRMLKFAIDQIKVTFNNPIRRHVRVRPATADKATGTAFRAAVQSTQTLFETVNCATQTETELVSIQKLCAELNKAKRQIGTLERQLQKKTRRQERINPILDIQVTLMLGFSWRQRQQLKNTLINIRDDTTTGGMDFLASTHEVNGLRRRLKVMLALKWCKVLAKRVETLRSQGRLKEFDKKLLLAIVGDRGCGTVKNALQIGNLLTYVNSPKNLTLIAFWKAPENRSEMEMRLAPVLEQLE
ncbi:hypothetical protein niasHT_006271 [Heterodera trifolii]|uniref:Uncharacterized protein n=1 Tax=Heterodera trifolii TaxID=157864 RepID=A0ABD2M3B6_9BILA